MVRNEGCSFNVVEVCYHQDGIQQKLSNWRRDDQHGRCFVNPGSLKKWKELLIKLAFELDTGGMDCVEYIKKSIPSVLITRYSFVHVREPALDSMYAEYSLTYLPTISTAYQ